MMAIEIRELAHRPTDWDEIIRRYPNKTLFHEGAWLDHVQDACPGGKLIYCAIQEGGADTGHVVGVLTKKSFVRIYGSPLPGTGTNYQGPLLHTDADLPGVLRAWFAWCRRRGVMHAEFAHPLLDALDARAEGIEVHRSVTHVVPLPSSEAAAWSALKSACRNRIRRAEKAGLTVEITSDASIADRFFEQYVEVFAKQGLVLPFGVERGRSLLTRLAPVDRVLPIWVKHNGEVVASGLFPFDEHAIYFWGAASWLRFQHLCPNELLHWAVMRHAIARGIPSYNMCGGTSRFKDKFGGEDIPYVRYSKSFLPGLSMARTAYEKLANLRLRVAGFFQAQPERPSGPSAAEE
jgi:hypothetical protein